jgi:hypothetical protein
LPTAGGGFQAQSPGGPRPPVVLQFLALGAMPVAMRVPGGLTVTSFPVLTQRDFFAIDRNLDRCGHPHADLVPLDTQDDYDHVLSDPDGFVRPSCDDKHVLCSCWLFESINNVGVWFITSTKRIGQ